MLTKHFLISIFLAIACYSQVAPVWVANTYIQAYTKDIITTPTSDKDPQPKYTITFSTAFSSVPRLAYGIQKYQGLDNLKKQGLQVIKDRLTASAFIVTFKIKAETKITRVTVRALVADPTLTQHIHLFHEQKVDVYHNLVNVTKKTNTIMSYINTIDYSRQCRDNGYSIQAFTPPLSACKVVLFLTKFQEDATDDPTGGPALALTMNTNIISTIKYQLLVTYGLKALIKNLQVSIVSFDQNQVLTQNKFVVVTSRLSCSPSGGFLATNQLYSSSTLVGFLQFTSNKTDVAMSFYLNIQLNNGVFGVLMSPSVVNSAAKADPLNSFVYNILYVKQYICPVANHFYDISIDMCVLCPITNCITCQHLNLCQTCDTANGYVLNPDTTPPYQCTLCQITNCITCPTATTCTQCHEARNYFLSSDSLSCILCSITNCLNCSSLTDCSQCDEVNGFYYNSASTGVTDICSPCSIPNCLQCQSATTCAVCDTSVNFYTINPSPTSINDQCIQCSVANCLQCTDLNNCYACDQINNYYLNSTNKCQLCTIPNCILCTSLTICSICDEANNFFLNYTSTTAAGQCPACTLTQCLTCATLLTCSECNVSNSYFLNPRTLVCQPPPPICGDNIHQDAAGQECEDGNLVAGDGCSELCIIQPFYICQPNPQNGAQNTICYYTGVIDLTVLYIQKVDNTNKIQVLFSLIPSQSNFWTDVDFIAMITVSNLVGVTGYTVQKNTDNTVSVFISYNTDIQGKNVTIEVDPSVSGKTQLQRLNVLTKIFQISPTDNQVAYFYQQSTYELAAKLTGLSFFVAILSILVFAFSFCAGKLVGIEMMGVIQISYLSIINLSSLNPSFRALTRIWFVNGITPFFFTNKYIYDQFSPLQVKGLYFYSIFEKNYNLSSLLIFVPILIGFICLLLTKAVKYGSVKYVKIINLAKRFFCQFAFTGIMFSIYVLATSSSLQMIYGSKNHEAQGRESMAWFIIMLLFVLIYFIIFIIFPGHFGQYKEYFKKKDSIQITNIRRQNGYDQNSSICQNIKQQSIDQFWYNLLIIERVVVGSCLVFQLYMPLSPLLPLLVYLALGIIVVVRRPYEKLKHNIRFACNMLICAVIQIVYLAHKLTSAQTHNKKKIWLQIPILICILLLTCVIYSCIMLVHELVTSILRKKQFQQIQQATKTQFNRQHQSYLRQRQRQRQKQKQKQKSMLKQYGLHESPTPTAKKSIKTFKQKRRKISKLATLNSQNNLIGNQKSKMQDSTQK